MVVSRRTSEDDGTQASSSSSPHTSSSLTASEPEGTKLELKREVGLFSGISLIVGTMIGSGIFISPKGVMLYGGSVGTGLLIWFACGVLATSGALCYAEVGTMIPKSGGEFPILLMAFDNIPAFLFVWAQSIVIKPASFAALAMTFSKYALAGFQGGSCENGDEIEIKMVAVVVILTVVMVNCASVKLSTQFLNFFSVGKILSLTIIIIAGIVMLCKGNTANFSNAFEGETPGPEGIALAFYQGLWAYDGWNQLNCVIEELKNPSRNLPRAIAIAMATVTGLYMMTNIAYLTVMTRTELLASEAVGSTFGERVLSPMEWIIPVSVTCSVFGTCLGSCFTAGRISYAGAKEGLYSPLLSMLHIERYTPAPAVLFNGFLAILMLIPNDFNSLVNYFSFVSWVFYGATVSALLYFRYTLPDHPRPIKVPLILPIFVGLSSIALCLVPIIDNPQIEFLIPVIFLLIGLLVYIPFYHFRKSLPGIKSFITTLQKLLYVAPPDDQEDDKQKVIEEKVPATNNNHKEL